MDPPPAPPSRVTKPGALTLPARISGARAFEAVARACLAHADANEGLIDVHGDHEAVHQFRVAYRRLRSLFSLCRDVAREDPEAARLKAGLRELTVAFGPARDLDVFQEAHAELTAADAARLQEARAAAYEQGLAFLQSQPWRQLRADLDRWLDAGSYRAVLPTGTWSGRALAAKALRRRSRRILAAGADLVALSPHDRHQVRIEAKKVRYGAQFFGSLWPSRRAAQKRMEATLSSLQDELGALNDQAAWTQIVQLAGLVEAEPPHVDSEAHLMRAQLLVWQLADEDPFWQRPDTPAGVARMPGRGRGPARPGPRHGGRTGGRTPKHG